MTAFVAGKHALADGYLIYWLYRDISGHGAAGFKINEYGHTKA